MNEYDNGRGIGQHIDTVTGFEGPWASLSLLSDIVINFKKADQKVSILLPARSLLI